MLAVTCLLFKLPVVWTLLRWHKLPYWRLWNGLGSGKCNAGYLNRVKQISLTGSLGLSTHAVLPKLEIWAWASKWNWCQQLKSRYSRWICSLPCPLLEKQARLDVTDNQGETRNKRGYLPGLNRTLICYKAHSDVQAPTSSNQSQFKSCWIALGFTLYPALYS